MAAHMPLTDAPRVLAIVQAGGKGSRMGVLTTHRAKPALPFGGTHQLVDIAMSNHDPAAFEAAARAVGFLGFGYYPRSGFMHIDLGPARSWGDPFPARPVPFAPELPPAREILSESRTLRGGGAAGAAAVHGAGAGGAPAAGRGRGRGGQDGRAVGPHVDRNRG